MPEKEGAEAARPDSGGGVIGRSSKLPLTTSYRSAVSSSTSIRGRASADKWFIVNPPVGLSWQMRGHFLNVDSCNICKGS